MKEPNTRGSKNTRFNAWRVALLFAILAVVASFAVMALDDDYSVGEIAQAGDAPYVFNEHIESVNETIGYDYISYQEYEHDGAINDAPRYDYYHDMYELGNVEEIDYNYTPYNIEEDEDDSTLDYGDHYNYSGYAGYAPEYMYELGYTFEFFESIGMLERIEGGIILNPPPEPTPNPYGIMPRNPINPGPGATWMALQLAITAALTTPVNTPYHTTALTIIINAPVITAPAGATSAATGGGLPLQVIDGRNVILQRGSGLAANVQLIQNNSSVNQNQFRHFTVSRSRLVLDGITLTRASSPMVLPITEFGGGILLGGGAGAIPEPAGGWWGPTLEMRGGSIIENGRNTAGGAISGGRFNTVLLHNAIIQNNVSSGAGGGISLSGAAGARLEMWAPTQILNNRAGTAGGGIMMQLNEVRNHPTLVNDPLLNPNGYTIIHGGNIQGNSCVGDGGGIRIGVGAHLHMHNGTIQNNFAERRGGGAEIVEDSTFIWTGGQIINNGRNSAGVIMTPLGGGLTILGGSRMYISGTNPKIVSGNYSLLEGGGIYMSTVGHYQLGGVSSLRINQQTQINIAAGSNFVVENNHTDGLGGGIFVENNEFVQLGVTLNFGAVLTMNGGIVRNNRADIYGGGIALSERSNDMNSVAQLFLNTGSFVYNNTAGERGGGVSIYERAHLTLNGGIVRGNVAALGGGGVRVENAQFTMQSGSIYNHRFAVRDPITGVQSGNIYQGGGVWVNGEDAIFTMTGGTIGHATDDLQGNRAQSGGGVWVGNGATFNMQAGAGNTSGTITRNEVGGGLNQGGGVWLGDATFTMAAGALDANRANSGGGVHIAEDGTFNMQGGYIRNHEFTSVGNPISTGGGVRLNGDDAVFNLTDGNILNNDANNGGGIQIDNGTVNMSGGLIQDNTSDFGGGAHVRSALSSFNMHGGTIHRNEAVNSGGGLRVVNGPTFTMTGGYITGNTSENNGGGVGVLSNLGHATATVGTTFIMTGGTIGGTTPALANTAVNGGGVSVENGATFTMDYGTSGNYGTIIGNTATGSSSDQGGGGVFVRDGTYDEHDVFRRSTFNFNAGVISSNRAIRGGGVYILESGAVVMTGGHIRSNRYTATNTSIVEGGGVWVGSDLSIFNMYGGTIGHATDQAQGNRAIYGGGVWAGNGSRFYMRPGTGTPPTITRNGNDDTASTPHGGGVHVTGVGSVFTMTAGEISHNIANNGGGVIVMHGARFYMRQGGVSPNYTYGHIFANTASAGAGGGVRVQSNINSPVLTSPTFTMSAGVIGHDDLDYGNWAFTAAGGVSIESMNGPTAYFHMLEPVCDSIPLRIVGNSSNSPEFNSGGGAVENNGGVMNMHAGVIENNIAYTGGGVFLERGFFNMYGGVIQNHHYDPHGDPINLGGGVRVGNTDPTHFRMFGGTIRNNSATSGGGVQVGRASNATFTMTGGIIGGAAPAGLPGGSPNPNGNIAIAGGGVWVGNGASFYMLPGGTTTLTYGRIIGNEATGPGNLDGGGGVNISGTGTTFTMRAGVIGGDSRVGEGNVAFRGGGGVTVLNNAVFRMEDQNISINSSTITTSGRISGNRSTGTTDTHGGGGVFMWGAFSTNPAVPNLFAHFYMEAGVIGGNSENGQANIGQHGGGIFAHTNSNINISGGTISGNQARACGGGINLGANPSVNALTITGGYIGGANPDIDEQNPYANTAGTVGGGVRIGSGSFFNMHNGHILGNVANVTGGGVVVLTEAEFNMYGGTIGSADHQNWGNTAPRGGGVTVGEGWGTNFPTAFNFYGGTIGHNHANYGGGVLLNNNVEDNVFNIRGTDPKHITNNNAQHNGGGVYVGWNIQAGHGGHMRVDPAATNIFITNNTAGTATTLPLGSGMGGGIFSGNHEYFNPLRSTRIPAPAGTATGVAIAYSNLVITDAVTFTGNRAYRRYVPPVNYHALPHLAFAGTDTSQPTDRIRTHTLNNYDINFRADDLLFEFYKTNSLVYYVTPTAVPLGGARFRVFRTDIDPTLANLPVNAFGLITFDLNGDLPVGSIWEEVIMEGSHISTDAFVPLGFYMTPGFTYQLVEYMAPVGFQIPFGQWRINLSEATLSFNSIIFTDIGITDPPMFVPNGPTLRPSSTVPWLVGNMPNFTLPLTGGLGTTGMVAVAAGGGIFAMALLAIPVLKYFKKTR